jgi:hypothetical protein
MGSVSGPSGIGRGVLSSTSSMSLSSEGGAQAF